MVSLGPREVRRGLPRATGSAEEQGRSAEG